MFRIPRELRFSAEQGMYYTSTWQAARYAAELASEFPLCTPEEIAQAVADEIKAFQFGYPTASEALNAGV